MMVFLSGPLPSAVYDGLLGPLPAAVYDGCLGPLPAAVYDSLSFRIISCITVTKLFEVRLVVLKHCFPVSLLQNSFKSDLLY